MLDRSAIPNPMPGFRPSSKVRREHESVPKNTADVSYLRNLRVNPKDLKQSEEKNNDVVKLNVNRDSERIRTILMRSHELRRCGNKSNFASWRTIRVSSMMLIAACICLISYGTSCSDSSIRRRLTSHGDEKDEGKNTEKSKPKELLTIPPIKVGEQLSRLQQKMTKTTRQLDDTESKTIVLQEGDSSDSSIHKASSSNDKDIRTNKIKGDTKLKFGTYDCCCDMYESCTKKMCDVCCCPCRKCCGMSEKCDTDNDKGCGKRHTCAMTSLVGAAGFGLLAGLTHVADDTLPAEGTTEYTDLAFTTPEKYGDMTESQKLDVLYEFIKPETVKITDEDGNVTSELLLDSFFPTVGWARLDAYIGIVSMVATLVTIVGWCCSIAELKKNRNQINKANVNNSSLKTAMNKIVKKIDDSRILHRKNNPAAMYSPTKLMSLPSNSTTFDPSVGTPAAATPSAGVINGIPGLGSPTAAATPTGTSYQTYLTK